MGKDDFEIPLEHAVDGIMTITGRLARLWMWSLVWLIHLSLFSLVAFLMWCYQVTPADLLDTFQRMQASRPFATFVALGGSVFALCGFYWKLVRRAHEWGGKGWLSTYLTKGLGE